MKFYLIILIYTKILAVSLFYFHDFHSLSLSLIHHESNIIISFCSNLQFSLILTTTRIDTLNEDVLNIKIPNNTELIEIAVAQMTEQINLVCEDLNKFKPLTEQSISGK